MTNLFGTIILTLLTNWTSSNFNGKEAGIVSTNYHAKISFEGNEYTFLLTNKPCDTVVWRNYKPIMYITNTYYGSPYTLEISK